MNSQSTANAVFWSAFVAVWFLHGFGWSTALAQDTLPQLAEPQSSVDEAEISVPPYDTGPANGLSASNGGCPEIVDPPLATLSVDIAPRDPNGVYVPPADRPQSCWAESGMATTPVLFVGGGCNCGWSCRSILQLARFCHSPLYFEDVCMERCGIWKTCPVLHSTAHFVCDLALLPARLIVAKKRPCLRSPTPCCCQPGFCGH